MKGEKGNGNACSNGAMDNDSINNNGNSDISSNRDRGRYKEMNIEPLAVLVVWGMVIAVVLAILMLIDITLGEY